MSATSRGRVRLAPVLLLVAGCATSAGQLPAGSAARRATSLGSAPPPAHYEPVEDASAEEYAVWAALLRPHIGPQTSQVVVSVRTEHLDRAVAEGAARRAELELSPLLAETDLPRRFADRATEVATLADRFELPVRVTLFSDGDLDALFSGRTCSEGWQRFFEEYPGAPGLFGFSRVAVDASGTRALVYVSRAFQCLGAEGSLVVLTRGDDEWEIARRVVLWRS